MRPAASDRLRSPAESLPQEPRRAFRIMPRAIQADHSSPDAAGKMARSRSNLCRRSRPLALPAPRIPATRNHRRNRPAPQLRERIEMTSSNGPRLRERPNPAFISASPAMAHGISRIKIMHISQAVWKAAGLTGMITRVRLVKPNARASPRRAQQFQRTSLPGRRWPAGRWPQAIAARSKQGPNQQAAAKSQKSSRRASSARDVSASTTVSLASARKPIQPIFGAHTVSCGAFRFKGRVRWKPPHSCGVNGTGSHGWALAPVAVQRRKKTKSGKRIVVRLPLF